MLKATLIHPIMVLFTQKGNYLSVTLFIVTGVSVLTILPWVIYSSMPVGLQEELSNASGVDIRDVVLAVIYFASSIVNPLVYAIRMQVFRKTIEHLLGKKKGIRAASIH